jgi:hypothetical protein
MAAIDYAAPKSVVIESIRTVAAGVGIERHEDASV